MSEEGVAKKRRKPVNLRLKTVAWLTKMGWCVDSVERKNRFVAYDYKGFADAIAIKLGFKPLGAQVCRGAGGSRAEHRRKLTVGDGAPGVREWLQQGGQVWLVCWDLRRDPAPVGKPGTGRQRWRIVTLEEVRFVAGQENAPMGALECVDIMASWVTA